MQQEGRRSPDNPRLCSRSGRTRDPVLPLRCFSPHDRVYPPLPLLQHEAVAVGLLLDLPGKASGEVGCRVSGTRGGGHAQLRRKGYTKQRGSAGRLRRVWPTTAGGRGGWQKLGAAETERQWAWRWQRAQPMTASRQRHAHCTAARCRKLSCYNTRLYTHHLSPACPLYPVDAGPPHQSHSQVSHPSIRDTPLLPASRLL